MAEDLPENYRNFLFLAFPENDTYRVGDRTFDHDKVGVFLGVAPGETDDDEVPAAGRALNRLFELEGWQLELFQQAVEEEDQLLVVGFELSSRAERPFDDEAHRTVFGLDKDDLQQWMGE